MKTTPEIFSSDFFDLKFEESELSVILKNDITMENARKINKLFTQVTNSKYASIIIDLSKVTSYDSFIVILLNELKKFSGENNSFNIIHANQELTSYYSYINELLIKHKEISPLKSNKLILWFENFGNRSKDMISDGIDFVSFIGEVIKSNLKIFYTPRSIRWVDLPTQIIQIGIKALPISLMIVFLIGLITGYQGAVQLKLFGADIYIADIISVSITRELAPLMVAIIVAGRSGSAFAAEIGTMKISEEIDALEMMGFNKVDFLVMPRLLAAIIVMPLIVMFADVIGILGGLLAAVTTLDITSVGYFNEMQGFLNMTDIFSGLIKSAIFAYFIAIIGCFRGLQVKGGAESVGRYTTSSVVTSIFHIILIDAVCTILFPLIGL
ncbi:MAG: hypothetical protein A2X64_11360 [Ignavibacteria bacterium GWF2_33_9]|nr:MAG: hypothetical protein A2X64_11360 [Ignavibacteria bacterium GWF2_33_9]